MSHDMIYERSLRSRAVSVAIALALALAALAVIHPWSATASSGTAGPATVTVTPTSALNDLDAVDTTATFAAGSVHQMTAHLCIHGGTYNNDADFALDGPWCSPNLVSPGSDAVKTVNVGPSDTSASLAIATGNAFHVGIGTGASWQDFNLDTHQLTCGPSSTCDLVIELAINTGSGAAFFVAPLTFAGAVTTTTAGATTTTAGATTTTVGVTTTTAGATTTTVGVTTTTAGATTTTKATTTTTDPATTTAGGATTTVAGGGTGTTRAATVAGAGAEAGAPTAALALTGARSRELASAAFLMLAAGLLLLSASKRRVPEQ